MKKKRKTCLKSSQQQITSSTTTTSTNYYYLPEECWESIFIFLVKDKDNDFESLSIVSKQFLSITNRLLFSLKICYTMRPLLSCLFKRFTNLTSLNISSYGGDLNKLLIEISCFPLNLTSLNISKQRHFPADGLQAFSGKITTLTSLFCSHMVFFNNSHLFLISDIFPLLQELDLSYNNGPINIHSWKHCNGISEEGIAQMLRKCINIKCLNLTGCSRVKLFGINFVVSNSKLEMLNLTRTSVDDETLYVISKSCCGLLKLRLKGCDYITENGVKHVIKSCTQLREINLRGCSKVHGYIVSYMVFSRPSLKMILAPPCYCFSPKEMKYLSSGGCHIC
ncbi:F-box/LRR-repeat protein 2-like [Trifolium pratense]|uniref:F-box/LRR-repeat protein 2-like n=1 Tax=Trifolium pratense TaxID=57577 RepID=UPI001E69145E|nr:F-box/LRR-repeat protein 2-like [Trifolium pratense]